LIYFLTYNFLIKQPTQQGIRADFLSLKTNLQIKLLYHVTF